MMQYVTHAILRERREEIMREWEALVASEPREIMLADSALRDHLPAFLDELVTWMEHGEAPGTLRMRAAAAQHAAQRLDHSFQLTQLIHEFRLLRTTILHVLLDAEADAKAAERNDGTERMAERVVSLARLNTGLDIAITDAVESFVEERERLLLDVRDREKMLRELDRKKNEFIAVLSHELRNPLAPIGNSLYLLDHAPPGSGRAARAKEIIHRQTGHLTRLVDDLLDVTRISRGKIELQRSRVDAREVVRRACDDHRELFRDRGIELRVEITDPVWIEADETRIAQVVGNLLWNAAKFSREGGAVTVSVETAKGKAEIRVHDDGIGIAPDLLTRLFQPFVQADGGLARTKGGLGLGLAVVKGLVELHGGTVSAHSAGLGRGSEFVLRLPLAPVLAQSASAHQPATVTRATEILVIEDNVDAAHSIADVLELEGHHVHVATDGRSGLAKARELKPEVVLCDIGLPDIDGYEIARTLRADGGLRSTRLIALSGYAQPEDKARAKEAGFEEHIAKPPSLDVLLASVARGALA